MDEFELDFDNDYKEELLVRDVVDLFEFNPKFERSMVQVMEVLEY